MTIFPTKLNSIKSTNSRYIQQTKLWPSVLLCRRLRKKKTATIATINLRRQQYLTSLSLLLSPSKAPQLGYPLCVIPRKTNRFFRVILSVASSNCRFFTYVCVEI